MREDVVLSFKAVVTYDLSFFRFFGCRFEITSFSYSVIAATTIKMCTGLDWRTPRCDVDENCHILFYLTSLILNRNDWILTRFTLHQSRSEYQSRSTTRLRRKQTSSVHLLLTRQIVSVTSNGDQIFYQLSLTDLHYWMLITCTFTVVDRRLQQPQSRHARSRQTSSSDSFTRSNVDMCHHNHDIVLATQSSFAPHLSTWSQWQLNKNSSCPVVIIMTSLQSDSDIMTSFRPHPISFLPSYQFDPMSAYVEDSREVIPVTHNVIIFDPDCSFLIILTTDVIPSLTIRGDMITQFNSQYQNIAILLQQYLSIFDKDCPYPNRYWLLSLYDSLSLLFSYCPWKCYLVISSFICKFSWCRIFGSVCCVSASLSLSASSWLFPICYVFCF